MRGSGIAIWVALATSVATMSAASGEPAPSRHALTWTRDGGAESCVEESDLRAAVEARLGRPVFVDRGAAAVVIDARVMPGGDGVGWRVEIAVRDRGGGELGARTFTEASASCRDLDDALALVIALIVDPDAGGRASPPPPPPPPPGEPPPPARPRPWRISVAARGTGAVGLLPGVAVGGALALVLDGPRWPAAVIHASLWREDDARVADGGAHVRLVTAGLRLCPLAWRRARVTLVGCAGGELARVSARGFGFDRSERAVLLAGYAIVEPKLAVALRRGLTVQAGLAAWIPLDPPGFSYDRGGTPVVLYRAAPVAVVADVGLGLHF